MSNVIHPLRRWLFDRQFTPAQFAGALGVSRSTVSDLINGKKRPSMALAEKIAALTSGAVMPNDFMLAPPLAAKPRKRRAAGATP